MSKEKGTNIIWYFQSLRFYNIGRSQCLDIGRDICGESSTEPIRMNASLINQTNAADVTNQTQIEQANKSSNHTPQEGRHNI